MKKNWDFLCIFLIFTGIFYGISFSVSAQTTDTGRIVRVGCVDIDNFLVTVEEEYVNGYAADYLEKIAEYTGWEYEYIQGSWAECLQWLEAGEIDLLLPAEYSEERAQRYIYSEEMCCMDYAALVGRKKDNSYYYEDYQAFNGMKVGMIEGNYLNHLFEEYAQKNNFTVQKVFYPTGTAVNQALEAGEVDAIISGNMNFYESQKLLAKIDFMPAYFITSKEKEELMQALNMAQNSINLNNPYYTAELHEKYYGKIERQAVGFTREEAEYILETGSVRVLYDPEDYPLEYLDKNTGEAKGIYLDLLKRILEECGLAMEAVPIAEDSSIDAERQEEKPEAVICASDYIVSKQNVNMEVTESFFTANYNLVGKRGGNITTQKSLIVAAADSNKGEKELLENRYPNWNIVVFESVDQCLDQVNKGKADLALVNALSQETRNFWRISENLVSVNADAVNIDISIGIKTENAGILKGILDKGIKKLDAHEAEQIVFHHILALEPRISLNYLIHVYPIHVIMILMIFFLVILGVMFLYAHSRMNHRQNQLLQEKNKELQTAIDIQHKLQLECESDPLTGLKNKKVIEFICEEKLKEAKEEQYALLVVDIDDFKQVNDTCGHLAGDQMLMDIAECMQTVFEKQIIGRIGGDEFLIMVELLQGKSALYPLLDRFYKKIALKNIPMKVTCSIGIALSQGKQETFRELFQKADQVLYEVKESGKNNYALRE